MIQGEGLRGKCGGDSAPFRCFWARVSQSARPGTGTAMVVLREGLQATIVIDGSMFPAIINGCRRIASWLGLTARDATFGPAGRLPVANVLIFPCGLFLVC